MISIGERKKNIHRLHLEYSQILWQSRFTHNSRNFLEVSLTVQIPMLSLKQFGNRKLITLNAKIVLDLFSMLINQLLETWLEALLWRINNPLLIHKWGKYDLSLLWKCVFSEFSLLIVTLLIYHFVTEII